MPCHFSNAHFLKLHKRNKSSRNYYMICTVITSTKSVFEELEKSQKICQIRPGHNLCKEGFFLINLLLLVFSDLQSTKRTHTIK